MVPLTEVILAMPLTRFQLYESSFIGHLPITSEVITLEELELEEY